jgi:AraC family transcriptional regulator of adaptative response/methylated-DNA-[protein]-cysteine methyltransferase
MTFMSPNFKLDPSHDPLIDASRDYARVARAIDFIVAERPRHPSLEEVAARVGLSAFHLQRLFKRWAGVSPKQLMGSLTLAHAKQVMQASASVLDATYEVGLSGPSRLHDLFITYEAMTPGEYKAQGAGLEIRHGIHDTPFGRILVLTTARGICGLDFIDTNDDEALRKAQSQWPRSHFVADAEATGRVVARIFAAARPSSKLQAGGQAPLRLLLRGTNFQVQVWAALLRVPPAAIVSYHDVARAIGHPKATRAVGTALAHNPVAYLVPCHRVLRATGLFKNYKWTPTRRHALLAWESARQGPLGAEA